MPLTDPNGPTGDEWTSLGEEPSGTAEGVRPHTKTNGLTNGNGTHLPLTNGTTPHLTSSASNPDFLTPMYDELETNLPKQLMQFSTQPFPDSLPLFPRHEAVQDYLEAYAADIQSLLQLHTRVLDIQPTSAARPPQGWNVRLQQEGQPEEETARFDAVVVASGHYNVPAIPAMPGLEAWNAAFPGSVSHSKFFRNADPYRGKRVVVVGNSASGLDIAFHLAPSVAAPLYLSHRSPASPLFAGSYASPHIEDVPEIQSFDPTLSPPRINLSDGSTLSSIDKILFCTGYHHAYPFLRSFPTHSLPPLTTSGTHTEQTYRHIFYRPAPFRLAFVGLGQKFVPFPTVEAQAAVIGSVWNGRVELCAGGEQAMEQWERDTLEEAVLRKGARDFHSLAFPVDARYLEDCAAWAAGEGEGGEGGVLKRKGGRSRKVPPIWDARMYWVRSQVPAIKRAFNELGEERLRVRTMEELGFVFDGAAREEVRELYGKE